MRDGAENEGARPRRTGFGGDLGQQRAPAPAQRCEKCEGTWLHCRWCGRCSYYLPKNGLCHRCDVD